MSMKPKVALVKDGFLPKGSENQRGRLSGAAIDRLKELAANGWDIEGYSVSKSTAATPNEPVKVEKVVKADPNAVYNVPDELRSENEWQAWTTDNGKVVEVGMRTVCNGCGASLTYCPCRTPRVWIDFDREGLVNFKGRTTPLPTKRW